MRATQMRVVRRNMRTRDALVHGNHEARQRPPNVAHVVAHEQQTVFAVVHIQREVAVQGWVAGFLQDLKHLVHHEPEEWQVPVFDAIWRLARMDHATFVK